MASYKRIRRLSAVGLIILSEFLSQLASAAADVESVAALDAIRTLNKSASWRLKSETPLDFDTFHPQGMVKINSNYFMSSVQIITPTERFAAPIDGKDRSVGSGVGHLFKFDENGNLLGQITLGENSIYHPGGIDFDGESIWVSVAEYRPNSRSIVYKVDPVTLKSTEVLRFDDHLGGIVHIKDSNKLVGLSWGSRRFYTWNLDSPNLETTMTRNPSFFIDYQDCQSIGSTYMLCAGVNGYQQSNSNRLSLGGLALINLSSLQAELQLPIVLTSAKGKVLTQNPFFYGIEKSDLQEPPQLEFMFVPDDNESVLYRYSVRPNP